MVVSKFRIGDEVETNEKYRLMAEDHNKLFGHNDFPLYRRGKVTDCHVEELREQRTDYATGLSYSDPSGKVYKTIIVVHIDDFPQFEHSLNQDFLEKVKE